MEIESKYSKNIQKIGNTYHIEVGELCVEMNYSEDSRSLYQCLLNVLKIKNNN